MIRYCSVVFLSALAIVNIGLLLYVAETLQFNLADRGIGPMHFEVYPPLKLCCHTYTSHLLQPHYVP